MAHVLVLEDEADIADVVTDYISRDNHTVDHAQSGSQAIALLALRAYDLLVIDWMVPDIDGLEVCRRYRKAGGTGHILMLTARDSVDDKSSGLETGADDYLSKPFHLKELMARVRALLRRPAARVPGTISFSSGLEIDQAEATVKYRGCLIKLVAREFELLLYLSRHAGKYFTAEMLLSRVWPTESLAQTDTVRTHIKNIRKKLEGAGATSIIEHARGFGYRICAT